jgi:hypothetical protein
LPSDPIVRQALSLGLIATGVLVAALLVHAPLGAALELYAIGLAVIGVAGAAAAGLRGRDFDDGPASLPAAWWRRRRRPRRPERLRQLEEIEHAAAFALSTAFDVHFRLRPHLVRIAEHRLGGRGASLADGATLLGPELWDVVRPDREPPADRHARGIDLASLRAMVERLGSL